MQRWHLAFFLWVNSGRFFPPPPFTKDPKWLFLCLCKETNWSGCKWKELPFIHKQDASSQDPSQLVSSGYLDESRMQSRVLEAFIQLLPLSGTGLLRGLFILPLLFAFWVVGCFSSTWTEFTGRKKTPKPKHYGIRSTWQMYT